MLVALVEMDHSCHRCHMFCDIQPSSLGHTEGLKVGLQKLITVLGRFYPYKGSTGF